MSIYRAPDPPVGPDRPSDAYPLTDAAEVRAGIRIMNQGRANAKPEFWQAPMKDWRLGPERFASHEDYQAARELDEWGCNPFEEE